MDAERAARTVEVRGVEFHVDEGFSKSWHAVKLYRQFNDSTLDTFEKLDLSFELIELATGCTEEQIVAYVGGDGAPATEVINFAAEIVAAINPKN